MAFRTPFILLRLGTNAEKKYAERMGALFSGYIVRGNFFESSPGMLTGLFLQARLTQPEHGFVIDPVTYVYALPPTENSVRSWQKVREDVARERLASDLNLPDDEIDNNWIREIEEPEPRDMGKVEILTIKRSYRALARKTMGALAQYAGVRAIQPSDINIDTSQELVALSTTYQRSAVRNRIPDATIAEVVPEPNFVMCPYFLIETQEWLDAMNTIWRAFESENPSGQEVGVIHISASFLNSQIDSMCEIVTRSRIPHWAVWINETEEDVAEPNVLRAYRQLVERSREAGKTIFNFYGGLFSLCSISRGLAGICNAPGYGESKSAEPISTGPAPAKFYIPHLAQRWTVTEAYDVLARANIGRSRDEFLRDVCRCPICQLGIQGGLVDLIPYYGETRRTIRRDGRPQDMPTGRALERGRFHFLIQRLDEFRRISPLSNAQVTALLTEKIDSWRGNRIEIEHLERWRSILRD